MLHGDSYSILVRYWVGEKAVQKECATKCPNKANQLARSAHDYCVKRGLDYFVEVCPRFGEIVAYGSNLGLQRRRGLFGA